MTTPTTTLDWNAIGDAYEEIGKAIDTGAFAAPEERDWKAHAAVAIVALAEALGLPSDLVRHVKHCPIGWNDGQLLFCRSTTPDDVIEWVQELERLVGAAPARATNSESRRAVLVDTDHRLLFRVRNGTAYSCSCSCGFSPPPGMDADDAMAIHLGAIKVIKTLSDEPKETP